MTIPAKIQSLFPAALLFCFFFCLHQYSFAQTNYQLHVTCIDKDSAFLEKELRLQTNFISRFACTDYINKLPNFLQAKGFINASVDSVKYDSSFAQLILYAGRQYKWAKINTAPTDQEILATNGWNEKLFPGKPMDFILVKNMQERTLNYLENNGYPFGKIYLDSLDLDKDSVSASLIIDRGPLYKIDSIRLFGNAKISNYFLQRYLDIQNGSIYNKEKLINVSKKMYKVKILVI